jgi:hypothetical protein
VNSLPEKSSGREKQKNSLVAFVVPAAVSLIIVWLLLRGTSWQSLMGSILAASPRGLALYTLIGLGNLWLRAIRFRAVLPEPKPAAGPVFLATLVQNAFGDLVPARLASFGSYVWLMKRRLAVAAEAAAATFIVSFVLDLVTLGPFLVAAAALRFGFAKPAAWSQFPLGWLVAFGGVFFLISLAAAWWLGPLIRLLERFFQAMARGKTAGGWVRAAASIERLAAALDAIHRGGALIRLLGISLAIRFVKYASLYVLTESLMAGAGYAALHLDIWDLIIGISVTELIASLPLPAIGQFGVWEGGMVGFLVVMGFAREPATLVAFGIHGITTAYEYLLCFLALGAMFIFLRRGKTTP